MLHSIQIYELFWHTFNHNVRFVHILVRHLTKQKNLDNRLGDVKSCSSNVHDHSMPSYIIMVLWYIGFIRVFCDVLAFLLSITPWNTRKSSSAMLSTLITISKVHDFKADENGMTFVDVVKFWRQIINILIQRFSYNYCMWAYFRVRCALIGLLSVIVDCQNLYIVVVVIFTNCISS